MALQVNEELPPDNAARLAIFDAMSLGLAGSSEVSVGGLFDEVIGRLRVLVPRELHNAGERMYVDEKVQACIEAGIIATESVDGQMRLHLTGTPPRVRYPDGSFRDYVPGFELARERLDRDNSRLRDARFDVRTLVPSIANAPNGDAFQTLLGSMREHGFLKQFPLVKHQDDVVVDGRARILAAATLQLEVQYVRYGSDKDRTAARRRDTPLNRVLIALDSNAGRLSTQEFDVVHAKVAKATRRNWDETAADLAMTAEWRRSIPETYSPTFEVKKLPYRQGDDPKIQVTTTDDKVMLRSLIEAAGLASYKYNLLGDYVPFENALTAHTPGRKAIFVRAQDLIPGIAAMQSDRRRDKRKIDPEWEQIRDWLIGTFAASAG